MCSAGLTLLASLLAFASLAFSQNHLSPIVVTGRSLAVEPGINTTNNQEVVFLTTFDGLRAPPLFPPSGEFKPADLGSPQYVSDYSIYSYDLADLTGDGWLVDGSLTAHNLPVATDTDQDGLPDFLELNQPMNFVGMATTEDHAAKFGTPETSLWDFSISRSAGQYAGSYSMTKRANGTTWTGGFQLKGGTGTVSIHTNNRTLSLSMVSFDTVKPETNTATTTYGITQDGKLLASGFWLNSSLGPNKKTYIHPFLVQRIGSTDRGRAILYASDGRAYDPTDPYSTPYPDYTQFHLEMSSFPAFLTQTPNPPLPLPWTDDFSVGSLDKYLDFRYGPLAQLEVSGGKLNFLTSANPFGDIFGNLSIYSPPYLLLPLNVSWVIDVQVALPAPDGTPYKGLGVVLVPEIDTHDIENYGATLFSFELGQENGPHPQTFLATYARKDWMEYPSLGLVTPAPSTAVYLRFFYDSSTKILSSYYDSNVSSPSRNWTSYDDWNLDPADPTSVAGAFGLTATSQLRMALWANAYGTNAIPHGEMGFDNLSIVAAPLPPAALTNGLRANLGQPFSCHPAWSNTPSSFSATNLPSGLTLDPASGLISGTPGSAGYYRILQTAINSAGSATFTIPLTVPGLPLTLPLTDPFTSNVPNRYMPIAMKSPASLVPTNGTLRYIAPSSDSEGAFIAWIPNAPLALNSSWEVLVDAQMPGGWETPWTGIGIALVTHDDNGTVETTADKNRLNLKFNRDTEDPNHRGNYLRRLAHTNGVESEVFSGSATNTPATLATLRFAYHAPSKTLTTWFRTNGGSQWQSLGTALNLDPTTLGSLGQAWGLSPDSTLRVALWGDSHSTAGSAGRATELDNLSISNVSGFSEFLFAKLDSSMGSTDGFTDLLQYASGATDPISPMNQALRPVTSLAKDTNNQPVLSLVYYARTGDTNLSIQPVWHSNLAVTADAWPSQGVTITSLGTVNTNGLVLERRQATIPVDSSSRKFLRLKATLNQ